MHISLTPELESMIHHKVASGLYSDQSEVVREALRRFYAEDLVDSRSYKIARLREAVAIGVDQADRGEFVRLDLEEMLKEIDNE